MKNTGCRFRAPEYNSQHPYHTICNFSFTGSNTLFWSLRALQHMHTDTHITNLEKKKKEEERKKNERGRKECFPVAHLSKF